MVLLLEIGLIHAALSLFTSGSLEIPRATHKDDLNGHNDLYKTIVRNLFGHPKTTHGITDKKLGSAIQLNKNTKFDFKVGNNVYYINKQNEKILGQIIKINPKRAKVNTANGIVSAPYSMLKFL